MLGLGMERLQRLSQQGYGAQQAGESGKWARPAPPAEQGCFLVDVGLPRSLSRSVQLLLTSADPTSLLQNSRSPVFWTCGTWPSRPTSPQENWSPSG